MSVENESAQDDAAKEAKAASEDAPTAAHRTAHAAETERGSRARAMAYGLAVIAVFFALGEGAVRLFGVPFPGSVLGMVLFFFALRTEMVAAARVRAAAALLTGRMGLFFVPAGVAAFGLDGDVLTSLPAIVAASVLSMVLVMVVVARLAGGASA
jgi:holin-like protein